MSILLNKVNYTYSTGTAYAVQALKEVSLKIDDGEYVGIIGRTGCGKSTLVQHFNGLRKAQEGGVYYNGADIWDPDYDRRALRSKVGLVFQYPEHQLFEKTIFDDVCFGPMNQGYRKNEAGLHAFEALKSVGLPEELFYQPPFALSGGQKRLAAIAGVLAMKPEVLVLDEPAAGLDPKGRDEMFSLIARLREERNITVILVSHSMEEVAESVGRILVMNQGSIVYDDAPAEVFRHGKELKAIGLAVPEVTDLMRELQEAGWNVDASAVTVEDAKAVLLKCLSHAVP